jgi:hypothetical protein
VKLAGDRSAPEEVAMLAPFCPTHGARVLVPPGRILAVFNTSTGIHVAYRCWCDDVGIWKTERKDAAQA